MENSNRLHQRSMMSIVNVLEECPELPELLSIHNNMLYQLRKLDAYGQKLVSSKAETFLSIEIDSNTIQQHIAQFSQHSFAREVEDRHLTLPLPSKPSEQSNTVHHQLMMVIINLLEECADLPDILNIHNDALYQLRKLNAYGQKLIAKKADEFLFIRIDSGALQQQLDYLSQHILERELEDEYLKRLAPCKLMRQLFGMHATEFSQRRKFLGLARQGQHRPRYCDKEIELEIWQHWKKTEGMDERERYLQIAQETEQPINLIYAAVKYYHAAAPKNNGVIV